MCRVPSRGKLSHPFTKETASSPPPLSPSLRVKQPLLDSLRSNKSNLNRVLKITRTKEDVGLTRVCLRIVADD